MKVDYIKPVDHFVFAVGHVDHAGFEAAVQIWVATLATHPSCWRQAYKNDFYLFPKELDEEVAKLYLPAHGETLIVGVKVRPFQRWALPLLKGPLCILARLFALWPSRQVRALRIER